MRIPEETIAAIEEAVQVEEVLSAFITLQKKGKKVPLSLSSRQSPKLLYHFRW